MDKQINNFLEFLQKDKKLTDNTLQSYKRDISQFENYINQNNIDFTKVDEEGIKGYLTYLQDNGKKTSTVSRNLASIRSFYQYEVRVKDLKADPTENVQSPKIEKRIPNVLSTKEVELLLEQPVDTDLKGIRDKKRIT